MNSASPFRTSRFEHDRRHLYYLPKTLFSSLESTNPVYLVGSRGTGKTTLLKALSATERIHNPSLRRQLDEEPFAGRYIGVYLKLPATQLHLLDRWMSDSDDLSRGWCISLFLDLVWIGLVIASITELIAEDYLAISPEGEQGCVEKIISKNPEIFRKQFAGTGPFTLNDLGGVIRSMQRNMEQAALHRTDWRQSTENYPAGQIGSFGLEIGQALAALCDSTLSGDQDGWRFLICMDEGECLTPFQQRVINTLVRLSASPVIPIVAFVSLPEDTTRTLVPGLTIQKGDRQLHLLDRMDDTSFKDLAEGVATIRVQTVCEEPTIAFSINRIFGPLDLNGLLLNILQTSVSPKAKNLLTQAKELKQTPFFKDTMQAMPVEESTPAFLPIYQAYLISKRDLSIPAPNTTAWERRRQDSAELRKAMVAAYLSICQELGAKVRYSSGDMLLQMSDNCMRDFLSQTQEVFDECGRPLGTFLSELAPATKQDIALRRASELKKNSLIISGVPSPPQTLRLIDGLAKLTAIVQSDGKDNRHLRSPERGVFEIDVREAGKRGFANDLQLLIDAGEAGFLKFLVSEGPNWSLRVHSSLAAAYEFSYRGAYYSRL